jgi:hypothetical protein
MKNMDESFDAKLIKRLRNYSEEPRLELWQQIAGRVGSNRLPANGKRLRSIWLLILGVITVGGLLYMERTKSGIKAAAGMSASVSSLSTGESADVSSESPISKDHAPEMNKVISGDSPSVSATTNRDDVTQGDNEVLMNQEPDSEPYEELNIIHAGDKSDRGQVENVTSGVNEEITNKDNKDMGRDEKVVEMKAVGKIEKKDEGKTVIREKKKDNKLSIYFTIMPTFGYQRIKSNSSDNIIIESVKRISTFSTDRLGVRAELGVEDPLTQRIKVFGGLVYYQRKQTINYTEKQVDYTEVSEGPDGQIIVVPKFAFVEKSFEYELRNLGVQLGLSFELSRKKLLQTVGTGFELHVALNKLESSQASEFTNNPSAYVFYNLYYRLQYPAEARLKAVFQPTLNYSFYIDHNLNAPFYVKPYGLGLNLGFTYNF